VLAQALVLALVLAPQPLVLLERVVQNERQINDKQQGPVYKQAMGRMASLQSGMN
jgi:hypothetical protein